MASAVSDGNGERSPTVASHSRQDDSVEYASYKKIMEGVVTGLGEMLCTMRSQGSEEDAASKDSGGATLEEYSQDGSGQESDEDAVDGPEEDYNTPSIADSYVYNMLPQSDEMLTVERLHASSELWFYPTLSRADALHMLDHKQVGVFMVRNSSKPGNYALSMRQNQPDPYVQHYLIQQTDRGLQVQGAEHFFDTLEDLIAHYCDFISGGMPTNLTLPQCVVTPVSRSELSASMSRESEILKLLEAYYLNPQSIIDRDVSVLEKAFSTIKQDSTRVCPPRSYFRRNVKMPVIRSLSRTTPRTPTLATPERHLASSAPAEPTPPALPPKRQRSKTTSQTSTKFEPCLPSRVAAFSHGNGVRNDVPPPLPPKQRMPLPRPELPESESNVRVPPPIPRRGNIPGTLSDEEEDSNGIGESPTPQRRHTVSSTDRNTLSRTVSNASEISPPAATAAAAMPPSENCERDDEGYLLPWDDASLANYISDRLKRDKDAVENGGGGRSRTSYVTHSYIDLEEINEPEPSAALSPPERVSSEEEEEESAVQKPAEKAQRLLGMGEPEHRRPSGPKITPSAWFKSRAANLKKSRFNKTATQRVSASIYKYATSRNTVLGQNVEAFIIAANSKPHSDDPVVFVNDVRQFMNSLKHHLLGAGRVELNDIVSRNYDLAGGEEINIHAILERTLHKVVLKPLKTVIYKSFVDHRSKNGSLSNLRNSLKVGKAMSTKDLGIRERFIPPQGPSLHQIGQHFVKMQKAFSPIAKVEHMLAAIQAVYKSVKDTQSEIGSEQLVLGADDFLPMMVYVLCQLEIWKIEIETEYLWALLDESLKGGEGGYYLTTLSGAVQVIGILAEQATSTQSTEAQSDRNSSLAASSNSTASAASRNPEEASPNGPAPTNTAATAAAASSSSQAPVSIVSPTTGDVRLPCIDDMQGFMRIHFDDHTGKTLSIHTLPVTVETTVAETCEMVAKKFGIKNPDKYALYRVAGSQATLLADDDKPQLIKADWLVNNTDYGQHHPVMEKYFGYRLRLP